MCINSDCVTTVVPIAWFWGSLSHTTLSWTALQYLWIWLFYMLISIPEMIFWVMHMVGSENNDNIGTYLLNIWVQWPGLYGGWILYFFTFLWPIIQMSSLTGTNQPGYANAAVQLVLCTITWLFTGIVHVLGFTHVNRMYERTLAPKDVEAELPAEEEASEPDDVEEEIEEEEPLAEEEDEDSDEAL